MMISRNELAICGDSAVDAKLRKIMSKILAVQEEQINDESSRKNIKAWTSLRHIRLMVAIEEEFGLQPFTMDEMAEMTSVTRIEEILRKKGVPG